MHHNHREQPSIIVQGKDPPNIQNMTFERELNNNLQVIKFRGFSQMEIQMFYLIKKWSHMIRERAPTHNLVSMPSLPTNPCS